VNDVVIEDPGVYVLLVRRKTVTEPFICVDVETIRSGTHRILIPAISRTFYLVSTKSAPVRIVCRSEGVEAFQLHRIGFRDLFVLVRARRKDWRLQMKIGQGLSLVPLLRGFGREAKKLARSMKLLRQWGFGPSTRNLNEALLPEQEDSATDAHQQKRIAAVETPDTVIVLHLYFRNLWSEFDCYLRKIQHPFHLIITTTEKDQSFEQSVLGSFPGAEIVVFENRGRDIGPFIQVAVEGRLDRFDYFCKLHGKRSGVDGPRAILGEVWRKATIRDLIGSDQQVARILSRFQSAPNLGMIGSSRFRLPNDFIQHRAAWGTNKANTLRLASQLGIEPEDFRLDFFAGSMFWARKAMLQSLRALNLSLADFPIENGTLDSEIHHALERLFGALPGTIGMFLEGTRMESGVRATRWVR
jgi:lipopolysaccharide biosynthesis protein